MARRDASRVAHAPRLATPPAPRQADVRRRGPVTSTSNPVGEFHARLLDLAERDLVGLAEAMPADRYDYRPSGEGFAGVRSFGEQVKHAATLLYLTAAVVLQERSPYAPGAGDNGPADVQGKEQIVAYLQGALAYARRAVASLDERTWLEPVTTWFGAQPRAEVAAGLIYHSYNHYGQMVVYARANGIVPPASRG